MDSSRGRSEVPTPGHSGKGQKALEAEEWVQVAWEIWKITDTSRRKGQNPSPDAL